MKMYDSGYGFDDAGYSICRSSDGINFYIVGYAFVNGSGFCILSMKLNPYGDTLWSKVIGIDSAQASFGLAVAPTPDGGCILSGDWDEPFTMKLNPDGTTGWFKQYSGPGYYAQITHIEPISNGGYIACGRNYYLFKVNSTGELQWLRNFTTGSYRDFYWVTEAIEGGYLTLSDSTVIPPSTRNVEITKWDVNGNIVWKKIFPQLGTSFNPRVLKRISNGYVLFGNKYDSIPGSNVTRVLCFSNIDFNYNSSAAKIIRENKNVIYSSASTISDNRYIFASYSHSNYSADTVFTYLRITDSSGNLLHQKNLFLTSQYFNAYFIKGFTTALNGDIVACGHVEIENITNRQDVYAFRIDSNLNGPIGIHQIGTSIPNNYKLYQNYPNPFNPVTTVKFDMSIAGYVNLKIFDILGREVLNINEFKTAGSYEVRFDGSNLASGIYFYSIEARQVGSLTGEFKDTKKMILVK